MGSTGEAEIPETPLEILIQKGVEDRVEAAVGVSQGDAKVPGGNHEWVPFVDLHHSLHDDEDVDGRPADDEGGNHHQDHSGDSPHVPVLFLGAGEQPDALQTQDHEAVTDGDDQHGNHEGEDEDADLCHRVPVPGGVRKLQRAHGFTWEKYTYNYKCVDVRL